VIILSGFCDRSTLRALILSPVLIVAAGQLESRQDSVAPLGQEEAEQKLSQLQHDISKLQKRLQQSRTDHKKEQEQLREVDLAIQKTVKQIRKLDKQKTTHLDALQVLENRRDEAVNKLQQRQKQLGGQIEATWRLARQSRVKLILNQDSPARLSRMLAYYDHINRAQLAKINALKEIMTELQQLHEEIDQELSLVESVVIEQQKNLDQQQVQKTERESLLVVLGSRIDNEATELLELERNREVLEKLLERLGDALADIPADLGQHLGIAAQKGRLPVPLKAKVRRAFGQQRTAGLKWHGWLMGASTGTEVKSIAYGRIAFSDWLRGYGLLMIIDHGQGFMSLYGYNESLLWEVGDWVEPGAIIATVGSSPSGDQGLYFEMRKDGKAVDPAAWIKR
jgi:septal ring factor EnvC (AmiA/AmiB activator)